MEKSHYFPEFPLVITGAEKSDVALQISICAWIRSGNCIPPELSQVLQNRDTDIGLVKIMRQTPTKGGTRTYRECIDKVDLGPEMHRVEYPDIANGRKYLLRADGRALLPQCYGVICSESGDRVLPNDFSYMVEITTFQSMLIHLS